MSSSKKELQKEIIDYLAHEEMAGRLWFTRLNVIPAVSKFGGKMVFRRMAPGAKKGLSDLIIFINGFTIWAELKFGRDVQSEFQKEFEASVKKHSFGIYKIFRSPAEIKEFIEGYLAKNAQMSKYRV